jgi:hypothetical protein
MRQIILSSLLERDCGQVAVSNENFVVPDVAAQTIILLVALQ